MVIAKILIFSGCRLVAEISLSVEVVSVWRGCLVACGGGRGMTFASGWAAGGGQGGRFASPAGIAAAVRLLFYIVPVMVRLGVASDVLPIK